MQRFCRAHLLCIWCGAILVVFSYVLFDLLDIDGSNFDRSPGTCTAAEERVTCEDADRQVAPGHAPGWLPTQEDRWTALHSSPTPTTPVGRPSHRPGRARAASTQPASDPARASAEP
jgi:hypothetical protein